MTAEPTRILVQRMNLAFAAGAVGASLAFVSPRFAGSVLAGAAIEAINLNALWRGSAHILGVGDPGTSSVLAVVGFVVRFLAIGFAIWTALYLGAHGVGLVIGLSLVVPVIVIVAWRTQPAVMEGLPAIDSDDPEWDAWNPWLARERDPEEDED